MQIIDDLRYNKTMKTATIVASMFVGLLLGTTVAVANAARPTAAPAAPPPAVEVAPPTPVLEASSGPTVITMPEVEIRGTRVAKSPVRKARVWTCGAWQDSYVGGRYQACEWK